MTLLADREAPTQGSSSSNSATNARSYLSQYTWQTYNFQFRVLLPNTGNSSLLPTPSVLLSHWWHRMLFLLQYASQAFVERLFHFVVCWLKALVIVWKKSLHMRAWLDLITWITDYVWVTGFSVLWITNSESLWLLCDAFINWLKSNWIVT